MSNVLRSTTFQLEFNGQDGITGVRTFGKAVKDADGLVDELNRTMGENTTVTVKNTKTKAELVREAKAAATQFQRNERRTERLTEQYKFLSTTLGKTADEMQVLNAVQQLGSGASKQQQEQVANSVRSYQQLRDAQNKQQGSLRNSRGVMQNFGWQMQDTVVQLQMGTSAFVVLSQQGSQMAAAFGPKGAVIGAVIALAGVVGGTLFTSLQSATQQTKKLDAANKALNDYLKLNSDGIVELTSKYEELARVSKIAADAQLLVARIDANKKNAESVKLVQSEIKDLNSTLQSTTSRTSAWGTSLALTLGRAKGGDIDVIKKSFEDLQKSVTPENISAFLGQLKEIEPTTKGQKEAVSNLITVLGEQLVSMESSKEILKQTEDGWESLGKKQRETADEVVKSFEKEASTTRKQTESLQEEYERRMKIILDFVDSGKKSEEDAVEAATRLTKWKTEEEEKIRKKAFEKQWGAITKAFEQEAKRTTKQTETIEQEYDRRYQVIKSYIEKPGHDAEEAAKAFAELEEWKTAALSKEYQKRERVRRQIENAQIQAGGKTDPVGAENDRFTSNMQTLNNQLKTLGEDRLEERKRINNLMEAEVVRHTLAVAQAEIAAYNAQIATYSMAAQQMTNLANLMSTGGNDVKEQVKEMNDAQKALFIITQVISAAQALVNGMSLGIQLAAMFPLAAPAMMAVGTGLGAATAGAIMGTTIAGAFDNGGYIPSGQVGAVAGFGDEFVNGTLIQGPANVTSRKDTAELLRDGAGNNGGMTKLNISVENKIEGGQYRVEQISEDRVKIIAEQVFSKNIDSGVSSALSNNNSKTSKSMRRNYKVGRNL